jgi:hypothetical protein
MVLVAVVGGAGYGTYRLVAPAPNLAEGGERVDEGKPLPNQNQFDVLVGAKPPPPDKPGANPQPDTPFVQADPVAMLDACLIKYQREVKGGFTAILEKHEQVEGKLHDPEVIRLAARHEFPDPPGSPLGVQMRMVWESGAPKDFTGSEMRAVLYDQKTDPKQIVTWRPKARLDSLREFRVDVNGSLARGASRYCIRDGGLYRGTLRTYDAWKARQAAGVLKTEYLGKQVAEKAGKHPDGRPVTCHVIRRTCPSPELDAFEIGGHPSTDPKDVDRDGFTEVTIMIDEERWLQVGTVIKRTDVQPERLIGEYYFRDVELNPALPEDTFTVEGMKAATK